MRPFKSILQCFALLLLAVTILPSCNGNDDEEQQQGFFRFSANGIEYNFDKNVGCYVNSISNENMLILRGDFNNENGATGSLPVFTGPGTYEIDSTTSNQLVFKIAGLNYFIGGLIQPKSHGQVTILQSRNEGSFTYYTASFSGVAYYTPNDSLIITNGNVQDESF